MILREEDLDEANCRSEHAVAAREDLRWLGISWDEGPDAGGPYGPYVQTLRRPLHRAAFERLRADGLVYPCVCSRADIRRALRAPHEGPQEGEEESIYPGTCRGRAAPRTGDRVAWRFRVPDGAGISFVDGRLGPREFVAGRDFGDFVVWRNADAPSYQLACAADDAAMEISEVVRGEDLLLSAARQILLHRAWGRVPPDFYHAELVRDEAGRRLAKHCDAKSLRALRAAGVSPEEIRG